MADFKFQDIEKALLAVGFKRVNNNGGSHQKYKIESLGFSQPVPEHVGDIVASGTAKSILDWVIFVARIKNINIYHNRYKLPKHFKDYIIKRHAEIKKNIVALIPDEPRKQQHIETTEEANNYLQNCLKQWKTAQKYSQSKKELEK